MTPPHELRSAARLALVLGAWALGGRAGAVAPAALAPVAPDPPGRLAPVDRAELEVTSGEVAGAGAGLRIEAAQVRAVVPGRGGDAAEVRFVLLGPSMERRPLASGELRRQVGLKLRAGDPCNLVYVMWRLEARPAIAVSVKRNPGQSRSAECGPRGYASVEPGWSAPPAPLRPGEERTLRAEILEGRLVVRADGEVVWTGALPPEAAALHGPPGLRTDNLRLAVSMRAAP